MKRLTEYTIPKTGFTVVPEEKYKRILMNEKPSVEKVYNRLKKIEDILGDKYDLERLKLLLDNDKIIREQVEKIWEGEWEWFDETVGTPIDGYEREWGWRCSKCKTALPDEMVMERIDEMRETTNEH